MMEFGKYQLREKLGSGGYGTVYRAFDTDLEVERAVKVLHPALVADTQFIEHFKQEARITARLDHSHIVPVYEVGEKDGRYYQVMKFMAGGSVGDLLEKINYLPYEITRNMIFQVGEALDYAHREGLVHRDVKPGNILIESKGVVRLGDFGLARAMLGASSITLSRSGGIIGTPAYMAPELWEGKEPNPGTDLYSLACVFYEIVVGKVLFDGVTPPEIMRKHDMNRLQYPEQWPEGVPRGIEGVLNRALAREPQERYPNVQEFLDELGRLSVGGEPHYLEQARCEKCGKIYDVRAERCPFCQLQEEERNRWGGGDAGKYPGEIEEPLWKRIGVWIRKNYLVLAIAAAVGLVVWLGSLVTQGPPPPATQTPLPATETPELGIGSTIVSAIDGMEMVYVPAGEFQMGSNEGDDDEQPVHPVNLEAYWIDKYEVSNAQYEQCVKNGVCEASKYQDDDKYNGASQPVVGVSWHDAVTYCEWAGRRLPGEEEWEKAARGTDGREYPWGNEEPGVTLVNGSGSEDGFEYTAPVGSYPQGAGPYGALDMSGNVLEWVSDWYGINYYEQVPDSVQSGPLGAEYRVLRGGSWNGKADNMRSADRLRSSPTTRVSFYGFRCALTAD